MRASVTIVALLVATTAATAQNGVTRTKRGDTTVIATQGNGRWGPPHDAIEVMRVPETRETTFGQAYEIQATPDGGVVIFDTKSLDGMIVRRFDANGKFVHNLGRSGSGPGEYRRSNLSIAVHPNGSVYVRDDNVSVSIWGPDGKLASYFPLAYNNGSTTEISAATDGSVYVRAPFLRTNGSPTGGPGLQRPMFHYDAKGTLLDSISSTIRWLPEGVEGNQWWKPLPDGRLLVTRTDKVGFLIVDQKGRNPMIAEGSGSLVPYLKEEREEQQVARNLVADKCPNPSRPRERVVVPEFKVPSRGSSVDVDGRIWIGKSATALKIPPKISASCFGPGGSFKAEVTYEEPPVFAAFLPDGTYLGEVRFPLRARVTFVGNTAWALVPDEDDVMTLVKYRLY